MNQIVKNTLALFTITAVAGLLLVPYTKERSLREHHRQRKHNRRHISPYLKRHPDSRKFPWTRQKIFPIRKKKLSLIQR